MAQLVSMSSPPETVVQLEHEIEVQVSVEVLIGGRASPDLHLQAWKPAPQKMRLRRMCRLGNLHHKKGGHGGSPLLWFGVDGEF